MNAKALAGAAIAVASLTGETVHGQFDCGYMTPDEVLAAVWQAVENGEIDDPALRPLPQVVSRPGNHPMPQRALAGGGAPCLAVEQIHPFEDTNQVLLTNFSNGELFDLMTDAANEVMTIYGDVFDFVGYWVNFVPDHQLGSAFYLGLENDVSGIGSSDFNNRPALGVAGQNIEGWVMMWNINSESWQPGTGDSADFVRTVLGQEFEHRFGMFLPDLLDGRALQGDNSGCGRSSHWNWKVDAQGSGMEVSDWVGVNPAVPAALDNSFNTDIGGVFCYPDLYLMGYVSGAEMDAGASELRYMNTSDCSSDYFGTITTFLSADFVASAGPRVPDSTTAQKDFRTAWVMIHLPNDPPSTTELDKCVAILEQHIVDFDFGTLGRGTMNNSLFTDCNCNGIPDGNEQNPCPDPCPWDCQPVPNGFVDIADMFELFGQWFQAGGSCDFNGGIVDITDLFEMFGNWGICP